MKLNKLGLYFDEEKCYNDLLGAIKDKFQELSDEIIAHFIQKAGSTVDYNTDGEMVEWGDWYQHVTFDATHEIMRAVVGNNHWWAFISNYGSGSEMDTSRNPFLLDYIADSYHFNKERLDRGLSVLTRGEYATPDWAGGTGYKMIKNRKFVDKEGNSINLEKHYPKKKRYLPYYVARTPSYWFDDTMDLMKTRFYDEVLKTVKNFPFHKYLKGGGD